MAQRLTLEEALQAGRSILFDTSVIFDAFLKEDAHGIAVNDMIDQSIDGQLRFTTELVLWEFLHWTRRRRSRSPTTRDADA